MSNFARVVRLALRHRTTVAAALFCSLVVAVLWAGSITAVLPIVDGVMHGKSIPELLDEKITSYETRIEKLDVRLQTLTVQSEITFVEGQRDGLVIWHKWLQDVRPTLTRHLPTTPFGTLLVICLALFAATFVKSIFRVVGSYFMARLGYITDFELRKEFYRRTLRLDLGTFRQTNHGDLMNRFTNEIGAIAAGTQTLFGTAVLEPLKMIACLAIAAWISWPLLLLTLISAPLAAYAILWLAKALKRANRRASEEFSVVFDHLEETFGGIKVMQAFTMESHERSRFHRTSKQYYRRTMRIAFYNSLTSPIVETMGIGMILAAVIAGGYLVLTGETKLFGIRVSDARLTHGMIMMFFMMLVGASDPVRRISAIFNSLQRAAASSDRVFELFDRTTRLAESATPAPLPPRLGRVRFHDVSFSYEADEPVSGAAFVEEIGARKGVRAKCPQCGNEFDTGAVD
ncbi:MAG: hypothetical protein IH898_05975 [Planctomycetes bacterium]|nr:hypothetical protein [Planctomycetota bacterium]